MLDLLIATLAVYRVSTDVAWMDGPLDLFAHARGAIVSRFGKDHWLSVGVQCPICLSFWFALPFIARYGPLRWLAIAGGAAFLARIGA